MLNLDLSMRQILNAAEIIRVYILKVRVKMQGTRCATKSLCLGCLALALARACIKCNLITLNWPSILFQKWYLLYTLILSRAMKSTSNGTCSLNYDLFRNTFFFRYPGFAMNYV